MRDKNFKKRICQNCNKKYTPYSGNQKFCDACQPSKEVRIRYSSKKYYWLNIEKRRKYYREHRRKIRKQIKLELIKVYGGKCIKCGFKDWRALQIDHIHGGGMREIIKWRKTKNPYQYYKMVIKEKNSGKYQLLCANCNWIKRFENKEFGGTKINA